MDTERASPRYVDIDLWEPNDILQAMIEGQMSAVAAVRAVLPAIEQVAPATEARLRQGVAAHHNACTMMATDLFVGMVSYANSLRTWRRVAP